MQESLEDLTGVSTPGSGVHEFALEVLEGLSRRPKRLSSRFFYDDRGSELFRKICDSEAYYPTRKEYEILESKSKTISSRLEGSPFNLIELGSGDGRKTVLLLDRFLKDGLDFRYLPIDISESAMKGLLSSMKSRYDGTNLVVRGLVAEYFQGVQHVAKEGDRRNLVLFLGSNIGNFDIPSARKFLRFLWHSLNDGDLLLIGFDLKKNVEILHRAYNDPEGITSEFNLNLLRRMNRELKADFDLSKFTHCETYNVEKGAMESYIVCTEAQTVNIRLLDKQFRFRPWEGIFTEFSYKFLPEEIEKLASDTGFFVKENLYDRERYFCDSVWCVRKENDRT